MKILVLNAWSSSLKYQLFDMEKNVVVVKWNVEVTPPYRSGHVWENGSEIKNHREALTSIFATMTAAGYELSTIDGIGHRVVHGGEYFQQPVIITDEVISKIEECSDLAPLHNPANLQAILACKELLPELKQVAVFDTAFHQTMEPAHYMYALPMKYYDKYKVRRYGFHGTSHQFVYDKLVTSNELRVTWKKPQKVITCHVGNGVSVTAIKDGKVVETSMGMTPLEGVMMGTRSGNIDSAIIPYLMKHESMAVDQVMNVLNKESGLLWVSGMSNDMRDILDWCKTQDVRCMLALEMYIASLLKYIWSYVALLDGVDALVLTAGIMENQSEIRTLLLQRLWRLWIAIDEKANTHIDWMTKISTEDSKVAVFVIPTNEELMIAQETFGLMINDKW